MYSYRKGLILGFHGCDKTLRDQIVSDNNMELKQSTNDYDWLGSGIYFWENNYQRAYQYAEYLHNNPRRNKKTLINEPAVLGAVIDLGYCLDFLDNEFLRLLKIGYDMLKQSKEQYDLPMPFNKRALKTNPDLLIRELDCAVIETIHQYNVLEHKQEYDSVRGVFFEGEELYPNAGFREKNHIQIAIRNKNCIKGYFIPRVMNKIYPPI